MSFSGAVLILAITVVRAVAINKLSKKTFLLLWGIALVRLLIPFSIPSTVSVYSLVDQNTYADTFEGTPMGNMIPIMPETPIEPVGEIQQAHLQQQFVESVPSVSVWFVIWCIGAVLCMVLFAIIYLSWLMRFQTSTPVRNSFVDQWLKAHRLRRRISIKQSDWIEAPLTYGIIRPVILMPKGTDWEDTKKLQYILLHEYVHICRYDTAIKLIAALALCIHWFNPLVWVMYLLLNRDLELSCDESVVRQFGVASRSTYAQILINMEAKKSGLMPFYNSFSKNAIEERIISIMKIKKASLFAILTAVVLVVSITSVFVTSAAKQSESQQADVGSDELTVNTQLLQYLNMTYAQFKEQVGTEAEFYHGLYFQAPIAGNDANVVFQGIYDEEVAGTVISDNDKSFRVESRLNDIISGISNEMAVTEFMEILDLHAGFTHAMYPDIQEGLTAYYVAYHYVEMNIDSNGDGVLDIQLNIALDESDHITPDALTWIYESTFFETSVQNDDDEIANMSGLSSQDLDLINGGIFDNQHNIYRGNIGNEEIRMLITRTGDSLYAAYTTRSGEGKVFRGNLANNAAGFVLNADEGEYLNGTVMQTEEGYFTISGEGVLSQKSVAFTLYQEGTIMMGDDLNNYYDFFGYNAEEAEQFAQQIKDSINDKTAFARLIQYPISIEIDGSRITIENEEGMIDVYDRLMKQNGFQQQVENIFTRYMFANYEGICIENGIIWVSQDTSGDYKIYAINTP
ncbi:MAG: M56 family metallopeptidase [Acetatifactor sp.]|nr:M56 family metallopeptidase [Acetatifactor sp.]